VNIYIDEAGAFIPTKRANYVSCAAGLIVPASQEKFLFQSFLRLRTSWGSASSEIKGSSLDEKQVARVLQLLHRHDVLAEICGILTTGATDEGITELKEQQAQGITAHIGPDHHPNIVKWLQAMRQRFSRLPNQLYLQSYAMTNLFDSLLRIGTGFWSQRVPAELGEFQWRIDAKDKTVTQAEELWRNLLKPYLETRSLTDAGTLCDDPSFDYSHFQKFMMHEESGDEASQRHLKFLRRVKGLPATSPPIEAVNLKALFQDLSFDDSKVNVGLQLADIVASVFHRACKGTLDKDGWRGLSHLFVRRKDEVTNLIAVSEHAGELQKQMSTNHHLLDVLLTLKKGARSMMVS
jgi:hypothetical protein